MKPSGEFTFLLHCVRIRIADEQTHDLSLPLVNWESLIKLAQRHRLVPHVCEALGMSNWDGVPDWAKRKLKRLQKSVGMKSCQLAGELTTIFDQFGKAGIPIRSFKGPTLAVETHGGLQRRQFNDLDLLIHPQDLWDSLSIFRQIGYQAGIAGLDQLSSRRTKKLAARNYEMSLLRPGANGVTLVDLHWRHSNVESFFPTDHGTLFDGDTTCEIGSHVIPTMPMKQQVSYLAYHACKHQCMRLTWLCDFAVAIGKLPRNEWAAFLRELNISCRRMVVCLLLLLEKLSLIEPLEPDIANLANWRNKLESVIHQMYEVLTSSTVTPLLGAYQTGMWQWRLSGRMSSFAKTFLSAALPAEQDLLRPGISGPWSSRFETILGKLLSRPVSVDSRPAPMETGNAQL